MFPGGENRFYQSEYESARVQALKKQNKYREGMIVPPRPNSPVPNPLVNICGKTVFPYWTTCITPAMTGKCRLLILKQMQRSMPGTPTSTLKVLAA